MASSRVHDIHSKQKYGYLTSVSLNRTIALKRFEPQEGGLCIAHTVNNLLGNTGTKGVGINFNDKRVSCHVDSLPGATINLEKERVTERQDAKLGPGWFHVEKDLLPLLTRYSLKAVHFASDKHYPPLKQGVAELIRDYCNRQLRGQRLPLLGFVLRYNSSLPGSSQRYAHAVAITGPEFTGTQFNALALIDSANKVLTQEKESGKQLLAPALEGAHMADPLANQWHDIWAVHYDPENVKPLTQRPVISSATLAAEDVKPPPAEPQETEEKEATPRGKKKRKRSSEQGETVNLRKFEAQSGRLCGAHAINNLLDNNGWNIPELASASVGCKRKGDSRTPNLQLIADAEREQVLSVWKVASNRQEKKARDEMLKAAEGNGDFSVNVVDRALLELGCTTRWVVDLSTRGPPRKDNRREYAQQVKEAVQTFCEVEGAKKGVRLLGFLLRCEIKGGADNGFIEHWACIAGPAFTGTNYKELAYIESTDKRQGQLMQAPAWSTFDDTLPDRGLALLAVFYDPEEAAAQLKKDTQEEAPTEVIDLLDDDDDADVVVQKPKKKKKRTAEPGPAPVPAPVPAPAPAPSVASTIEYPAPQPKRMRPVLPMGPPRREGETAFQYFIRVGDKFTMPPA